MRTENSIRTFVIRNLKFVIVLTAADEMHDFDFIGIFNSDTRPIFFADDFSVQFNRNSFGRQREQIEQFAEIYFFPNFFGFAVHYNRHFCILHYPCRITRRSSASSPSLITFISIAARPALKCGNCKCTTAAPPLSDLA